MQRDFYIQINSNGFPSNRIRREDHLKESQKIFFDNEATGTLGIGIISAYAFAGSVTLCTFPTLVIYTTITLTARILVDRISRIEVNASNKKIFMLTSFFLTFGTVFFLASLFSVVLGPLVTILSFGVIRITVMSGLILTINTLSFITFQVCVGAFLKSIAYKIYKHVHDTYNKFFAILKAGEKDPRGNGDVPLCNTFAKHNTPTIFNDLPPEMFLAITQFLSSKDALEFRICSKALFSLTFNRDILKKKINENFAFDLEKKDLIKVQNQLLESLYTYPLDLCLPKTEFNFYPYFTITRDAADAELDYVLNTTKKKIYWTKLPNNKLCIAKNEKQILTITNFIDSVSNIF